MPGTALQNFRNSSTSPAFPLHADHLHHHLQLRPALLLHAREADEVVADFVEVRALAVELEALLLRAVEAEGELFERRVQTAAEAFSSRNVPLVESSVETLWRWQNSMRS